MFSRIIRYTLTAATVTILGVATASTIAVILLGGRRCGWCGNEHR